MSGPVEVQADLGTVRVIPFGSEQVQLRCKVRLGKSEPLETVLLLGRVPANQIANGLTGGALVELINSAGKVCIAAATGGHASLEDSYLVPKHLIDRLSQAAGVFR